MSRMMSAVLVVVLTATLSGQSKPDWHARREACVAALSSFAGDPGAMRQPQLPNDLEGVALEYSSSGCYGRCPAFTLRLERTRAAWEGHAYVKKKGKGGTADFGSAVSEVRTRLAGREHIRHA